MNRNWTGIMLAALLAAAALAPIPVSSARAQALAQWPKQCRGDISRICRDIVKKDDKAILVCLQENENKLSQACRKLLQSYGHVPDNPGKRR